MRTIVALIAALALLLAFAWMIDLAVEAGTAPDVIAGPLPSPVAMCAVLLISGWIAKRRPSNMTGGTG